MAAVLALAAGCGEGASSDRLSLRIEAGPIDEPDRIWNLRCDPPGGSWPQSNAACRRLSSQDLRPIGPETRDLVAITPVPVRVVGTAFGQPVQLVFESRGSSTRRDRFEELSQALGLQQVLTGP